LDVLQDTLTVLNQALLASSDSIPTASAGGITTDKKMKQEEEGRVVVEKKFKDDLSSSLSDLEYTALLEQAKQAEDFGIQYLEHSIKFASDPTNGPTFKRKSKESYVQAASIREIANSKLPASLNTPRA
jgi:predicted outer membrane protein